jgi:hypothetical protein
MNSIQPQIIMRGGLPVRRFGWGVLIVFMLAGCIRARPRAPVAPPEIANSIRFPEWNTDAVTTIEGPQLKALQIALEEFSPPGRKPPKGVDEETRCLLRLDTYDVMIQRGEKMTFIHFTPKEDVRCGFTSRLLDLGASYAISDDGVILKRD